jgi:hypothetical protein
MATCGLAGFALLPMLLITYTLVACDTMGIDCPRDILFAEECLPDPPSIATAPTDILLDMTWSAGPIQSTDEQPNPSDDSEPPPD